MWSLVLLKCHWYRPVHATRQALIYWQSWKIDRFPMVPLYIYKLGFLLNAYQSILWPFIHADLWYTKWLVFYSDESNSKHKPLMKCLAFNYFSTQMCTCIYYIYKYHLTNGGWRDSSGVKRCMGSHL